MALQPQTQEALLQLLLSAAQDEWQEVSAPARSWLQRQAMAGAAAGPAAALPDPASAFAAASERLLLQLIQGLPDALRSGDLAGRQHAQQLTSAIQARSSCVRWRCWCTFTQHCWPCVDAHSSRQIDSPSEACPPPFFALQVCMPAWFAANVVQHPLRLQQLLSSFMEAFEFDASIAGMLLYAAAAPGGSATTFAAGGTGDGRSSFAASTGPGAASAATGADAEQQLVAAGGDGSVVLLPRMPLGLAVITTAKAYESVASVLQAAAGLAAAADAVPGSSGTALRCLFDGCLGRLQQLSNAASGAMIGASSGGSRAHKRSRQQQPSSDPQQQADPDGMGQTPWQLQAAAVAVVLSELLLGASPAWQPSWQPGATPPTSSSRELEALAASVVQDLVQRGIWSLPTSAPQLQSGAASGSGSGGLPLLLEATPLGSGGPQQHRLTAQQLGCNALLLKAAIECCGTAARALGPRFAQNGRLLRAALLPLLEKLGMWQGAHMLALRSVLAIRTALHNPPLFASQHLLCCFCCHHCFAADGAHLVSSAAQAAVASVCWWCGYSGSLQRLVAANADYVVDGMCRQLRQVKLCCRCCCCRCCHVGARSRSS